MFNKEIVMKMKLNKKGMKNLSRDVHSVQLSNTDKVAGGYMANISVMVCA